MLSPRRVLGSAIPAPHLRAMRTHLFLFGLALAAAPLAAPILASPAAAQAPSALTGPARTDALARANASLNRLRLIEGRFQQIAPDGQLTSGAFQLQRPGKVRFAYDPPNPLLLVSDGVTVAFQDSKLKSVDRTPLRSTPLFFVLKAQVDLAEDGRVTQVARDGGQLLIDVRDRRGEAEGLLTLIFSGDNEPELRGWRIRDGTGQTTSVNLLDLRPVSRFDARLFQVEDSQDSTARRLGGR